MGTALERQKFKFTVGPSEGGRRFDVLLTAHLQKLSVSDRSISRSQAASWITEGLVKVDRKPVLKPSLVLKSGAVVEGEFPQARKLSLNPETGIKFRIVHEDRFLLVIDKPAGLTVHPGAGQRSGTLVNALLHHLGAELKQIGDAERPGIVHRLDKETSGLMVIAKTERAYRSLIAQLKVPRTMKRRYLALTYRLPKKMPGSVINRDGESGTISLPLGRHPQARVKMAVLKTGGKEAQTSWRVKKFLAHGSLLAAELGTGRTHQIRVHFSHCAAPIVGDQVYGSLPQKLPPRLTKLVRAFGRQALHASELSFLHPESGEELTFKSAPGKDFQELLEAFSKK